MSNDLTVEISQNLIEVEILEQGPQGPTGYTGYTGPQGVQGVTATFKYSDGSAFNITGYTVLFTVKKECDIDVVDTTDTKALIKKTVTTHSDPTHGITIIPLTSTDTNQLPGIYYWDLQLVKSGIVSSTQRGELEVTTDITRRVS